MPKNWGTRWRTGIVTMNWHWHSAMLARFGNWLSGRGFKTDTQRISEVQEDTKQILRECEKLARQLERPSKRSRGTKITIKCPQCGKKFKRDPTSEMIVTPHNSPHGFFCEGGFALLVDYKSPIPKGLSKG